MSVMIYVLAADIYLIFDDIRTLYQNICQEHNSYTSQLYKTWYKPHPFDERLQDKASFCYRQLQEVDGWLRLSLYKHSIKASIDKFTTFAMYWKKSICQCKIWQYLIKTEASDRCQSHKREKCYGALNDSLGIHKMILSRIGEKVR